MSQNRFVVKNGLDNNNNTITNVSDPTLDTDVSTKGFSRNASNIDAGTLNAARLDISGVTAGSYGLTNAVPVISVDDKGRITSATNQNIAVVTNFAYDQATTTFSISTGDGNTFPAQIPITVVDNAEFGSFTFNPATTTFTNVSITTEEIQDVVGAMVDSVNEFGISVTYDDVNGKLNYNVNDFTISLAGDLGGSVTITDLASATLTATVQPNSVELGADTTGDYVGTATTVGNGISGSASGEGSVFTVTSNATDLNTPNTIVFRDINGDFAARNLIGNSSTATALETARTIALAGDIVGSVVFDGTQNVTISTTVQPNSVALGTDTTGNYVGTATTTGLGISGSATGEGSTFTVSSNATAANTVNTIVYRDATGSFSAHEITLSNDINAVNAILSGNINAVTATLSGDLVVNGGDIITPTTANIALNATTLNIGQTTGSTTIRNNLTVSGNLVVNGTTTSVNTQTVTISDPVVTYGAGGGTVNDGKDRGVAFEYGDGTVVKTGFFGWDRSTNFFTFVPDATLTDEVVSGALGTLDVASITGSASRLTTPRTISLSGDIVGSVSFDGSANVNITTTVQPNSVALGTDTTGNYLGTVVSGNAGIVVTGADGEGVTKTILHADTSAQASVNNAGNTFIQDITLDEFGHITGIASATAVINDGILTVSGGSGLTGTGTFTANQAGNTTITISHADTSAQASVDNTGNTFIQDIILDGFGHITGITSATAVINDGTLTVSAGTGLTGSGTFTANQAANATITISHADTSAQASINNANGVVIQDITLDGFGHITAIGSVDLDGRYYTEAESNSLFFNVSGDTVTGASTFNADVDFLAGTRWDVSAADQAHQRAEARDDATNFARLHWYGVTDAGASSNFRHAWYDGVAYIKLTAVSNYVEWTGGLRSTVDMRAPIYYDRNDTGYYADFNSISSSAIRVRGGTYHGPNTTWGAYLSVGANGREFVDNTFVASVVTTNGNLHMDAASGKQMYLNYYDGTLIYFGGGANNNVGQIDSAGNLTMNGNVTAYSDVRLKEDISTIDSALDKVLASRGVYYTRKDDDTKRRRIGVIAQELEKTFPEAVIREAVYPKDDAGTHDLDADPIDHILTVDYGNLAGAFIEAIKEQQAIINKQQEQIDYLMNRKSVFAKIWNFITGKK